MMQIIAGDKRGTKLQSPNNLSVRPTAQRTREALFSILQGGRLPCDVTDAIIIDLFAGSGALGLEALSRGASKAFFVEKDHEAIGILRKNISHLGYESASKISQSDALKTVHWPHPKADIIFCDPPYDKEMAIPAIMQFYQLGAFSEDAVIIIEARKTEQIAFPENWQMLDERRYGIAALYFGSLSA